MWLTPNLLAQNNQLRNEKGKKMSKTQTNEGRDQIQKLENYVGNVQTQLNHEKKELEVKFVPLTARIDDCKVEIEETRRSQEADVKKKKIAVNFV